MQYTIKQILFIASFGLLALLMQSCSANLKVPKRIETDNEVDATVSGGATVTHEFKFDLSTFREVCEAEYADEENEQLKEQLIADCQAERLEEFLDLLASLADEANEAEESESAEE
jgi:hypothetical protein